MIKPCFDRAFWGVLINFLFLYLKFSVFTTIKCHKPNLRFLLNISYLIKDKLSGGVLYTKYTPKKCIRDKKSQLFSANVAMPPKKTKNVTSLTIFKTTKFMIFFNSFCLFYPWINNIVVYQDNCVKKSYLFAVYPS